MLQNRALRNRALSENTRIIPFEQSADLNDLCREYEEITKKLEITKNIKDGLASRIMSYVEHEGKTYKRCLSNMYLVTVINATKYTTEKTNLNLLKEKHPDTYKKLVKENIITTTEIEKKGYIRDMEIIFTDDELTHFMNIKMFVGEKIHDINKCYKDIMKHYMYKELTPDMKKELFTAYNNRLQE